MCFCRIENLEQSNEGVYICRASSSYGQAQDAARLTIQGAFPSTPALHRSCGFSPAGGALTPPPHPQISFLVFAAALPKVMINVRTSVQTVMIGNSVEFECQALGEPQPTVQWSKVGGPLPAHIMVKGGMLRIQQVTEADAGQYRCTATNDVGSVQSQVVLNVQCECPHQAFKRGSKLLVLTLLPYSVCSSASNFCAAGEEGGDGGLRRSFALCGVRIPRTRDQMVQGNTRDGLAVGKPTSNLRLKPGSIQLEGELPPKCFQEVNVLTVPRVAHEDSGTYVCTASNKQGKVEAFTWLQVHGQSAEPSIRRHLSWPFEGHFLLSKVAAGL